MSARTDKRITFVIVTTIVVVFASNCIVRQIPNAAYYYDKIDATDWLLIAGLMAYLTKPFNRISYYTSWWFVGMTFNNSVDEWTDRAMISSPVEWTYAIIITIIWLGYMWQERRRI